MRALRWAVAGSVVVMIAAGGLFYYASQLAAAKRQHNHDEVVVNINAHSCDPNELTVPAGRASFRIVNRSDRAVEWEILDGVLVVEERENIAAALPGSEVLFSLGGDGTFLRAAAAMLDVEAQPLIAQLGRIPEAKMLLMAGLMLAVRDRLPQLRVLRQPAEIIADHPAVNLWHQAITFG